MDVGIVRIMASAVLPLMFLGVLTLAQAVADEKPFWERVVEAGWDMCILGIGLTAGLFANTRFIENVGPEMAVFATSAMIAIDLIFALIVLLIIKKRSFNPLHGTISVMLGLTAVAVPLALLILGGGGKS